MTANRCSLLACMCAALGAAAISGCQAAPHDLSWTIDFETPALATRAASVHAAILEGGCGGPETYGVDLRPGGAMSPSPPRLARGSWGFSATASDATCVAYASDCQVVELPSASAVRLVLHAAAESAGCAADVCDGGICRTDAGASDAGTTDATEVDAATVDACPATEGACADRADGDCDTLIDCDDPDCAAAPECDLCLGVTCGECESCSGGACGPASGASCSGGSCAPAGNCCTGCFTGTRETCETGNTDAACGTGGARCDVCGPCEQCSGSTCVPRADGVACATSTGVTGICDAGACCTGCFDGSGACVTGSSSESACGRGGAACAACTECHRCSAGACIETTGSCGTNGRCHAGACCDGNDHCWNGTACVLGTTHDVCGGDGGSCSTCPASWMCCPPPSSISDWHCSVC